MSDLNWDDLLKGTPTEDVQTEIKIPASILDTIPTFNQPVVTPVTQTIVPETKSISVDFSDLFNSGVSKPVTQPAPTPQITIETVLTEQTDDDNEDEYSYLETEDDEEDEDNELVTTTVVPFSLLLPENKPQPIVSDIDLMMQTQSVVEPRKRGPGRPRKENVTIEEVVSKLPITIESEQDKSTSKNNIETLSAISQQSKETVTTEIPKKEILEIANSLQRISESLTRIGKS